MMYAKELLEMDTSELLTRNVQDILRWMQSLALTVQSVAEREDLDYETFADMAELMGDMAAVAKVMITKAQIEEGVV